MECLRNPTKYIKLLCLACFDMPFPLHVAQRVAQGVTVNREFCHSQEVISKTPTKEETV
jgi:hypothetical protein